MEIIKSLEIGSEVLKIIAESDNIHIHSVFNRVINLCAANRIVSLATHDVDVSPNTVVTELSPANGWPAYGLSRDSHVAIRNKSIYLDEVLVIELWPSRLFTGKIISEHISLDKQTAYKNLQLVRSLTSHCENSPLSLYCAEIPAIVKGDYSRRITDPYCASIINPLRELTRLIQNGYTDELSPCAHKLIGFGNGLTPAGDDILSGLMLSLAFTAKALDCADYILNRVNPAIIRDSKELTTLLSAELLYYAAKGLGSASIEKFLTQILNSAEEDLTVALLNKVLDIGHSSGFDIVFGILLGTELGLSLHESFKH